MTEVTQFGKDTFSGLEDALKKLTFADKHELKSFESGIFSALRVLVRCSLALFISIFLSRARVLSVSIYRPSFVIRRPSSVGS